MGNKKRKAVRRCLCYRPHQQPAQRRASLPRKSQDSCRGREHSPGVTPWCPIACQALWSTAWCRHGPGLRADTLKPARGDTEKPAPQVSPLPPRAVSEEDGELGLVPLPARATPLAPGNPQKRDTRRCFLLMGHQRVMPRHLHRTSRVTPGLCLGHPPSPQAQ